EFADQNHEGKESEDNIKFHWEDEIVIAGPITEINDKKDSEYILAGVYKEKDFSFSIPNIHKLSFEIKDNQNAEVAVSKSILEKIDRVDQDEETIFHFYLKEREVFANP